MKLQPVRGAQWVLYKEQTVKFDDFLQANTSGAQPSVAFGAGLSVPFSLPIGARVIGGNVDVITPFTGDGVTSFPINVGDVNNATRYASVDAFTAGLTAIPANALVDADGTNAAIVSAPVGGVPTAGLARIGIQYVIDGRVNENQIV